jgi:drug/metabolite transporter (DMT)-like permease
MNTDSQNQPSVLRGRIITAFAAIYIIWGSTYLGIRFAVETLPPFVMGGTRFLIAGLFLYGLLWLRGVPAPALFHWRNAASVGVLLIGFGNGGVCWAEQKVPSGLTALLIAVTPLWFALIDWVRPGGARPRLQTLLGILIGFAGVVMLVGSRDILHRNAIEPAGALALMLSSFAWAGGSLYARYTPKPESPMMGVAMQMIAGGLFLLLIACVAGEPARIGWQAVSGRSVLAFAYLILVGSLVGFTAYSWLLKVCPPVEVSTYAYVNPVVAVFLGWSLGGETFTLQILWAAVVIVLGVVIITTRSDKTAADPIRVDGADNNLRGNAELNLHSPAAD